MSPSSPSRHTRAAHLTSGCVTLTAFGLVIGPQFYFRAPETTIELSRNPLRIYGVDSRREWIIMRGRQDGREFQLAMTKRYFLDDVWTALAAAGAVPTSGGPSPRTGRNRLNG